MVMKLSRDKLLLMPILVFLHNSRFDRADIMYIGGGGAHPIFTACNDVVLASFSCDWNA